MAQTTIEKTVCGDCGAETRPNALFCHNCGGEISVEKKIAEILPEPAAIGNTKEKQPAATVIEQQKKPAEFSEIGDGEKIAVPSEANIKPERKPKSAASMRRKSKSIQKATVELVWEEHDNAPNVWFIGVTVFLVIVASAIIFLAMYLR